MKSYSKNRCVFSCCRKEVKDEMVRMAGGMLFHARDAATGKARSPRVDRCTAETTSVMYGVILKLHTAIICGVQH